MSAPKFSVIVPVFNQSRLVRECLSFLAGQSFPDFEVILVDNASRDLIPEKSLPDSLKIKMLRFPENRYFAEAVNAGYAQSSGDWILVLNSDVTLEKEFLSQAAEAVLQSRSIQCANGVLYSKNGKVDSCGVRPGKSLRPRDIRKTQNESVFGPSGAAFFLKRDLCERLIAEDGFLLDPGISFFYADLDLAFRLREKGIHTRLIPNARGTHQRAGSTSKQKSLLPFAYCRLATEGKKLLRENRRAFLKKWGKQKKFWNLPFVWAYDGMLKLF